MTARFRLAGPDDLDLVTDLVGEFTAEEGYPYERGPVRAILEHMFARDDVGRVWLALDGEDVAGYVALCFGWSIEYRGRDAFVDELYVRPAFRGRGHGTALLQMVAGEAPKLSVNALHLEVERRNEGARRLYERLGYADKDRQLMTRRLRTAGLPPDADG